MNDAPIFDSQQFDFYGSTLNNLAEGIIWTNSSGIIVYCNESASLTIGRPTFELMGTLLYNQTLSGNIEAWLDELVKNPQQKKPPLLVEFKSGERILVYVMVSIALGDNKFNCFLLKEESEKSTTGANEMLRLISEGTASVIGSDFFRSLAYHIIISTGIRYAIVTECANAAKTRVRTLVYVERDNFLDNFEYDLTGTPCEIVMKGDNYYCSADLDHLFPKDEGVKSYFGVPIFISTGEIAGHLAIFDTKPLVISEQMLSILKIFASRAGAEIERKVADEKLKKANAELKQLLDESEQRFRDLFEQAPIAYVHEGLDSKFIKANRAALKILGVRPDEVPDTYGASLAPDTPDAQRRLKEAFESVGRGTDTSGVVLELRRKDNGKPIWIQWWSNPDLSGKFTRTMFVDITDRVLMEQEQLKLLAQNEYLQEEIKLDHNFDEIISKSKKFQGVLQKVEQVASTDATVLILGESGTGKELLCRAIHSISKRSKQPLVKINCAALPANLIESELFGHEKGAFTGAIAQKIGRFELADRGTLFLDEIGEMPLDLQSKLLRVLQEGEFERVGSPKTIKVNVRIIAATNRDLHTSVNKKEFREDLYYRLNVFPITSPSLRERKEDIPVLVDHFCKKYSMKLGKKITSVSKPVLDTLMRYEWPGNVRELENIMERGMIVSKSNVLEPGEWLPKAPANSSPPSIITPHTEKISANSLEEVERNHIVEVLNRTQWKIRGENGAAKILNLNPTTLEARMKKLGIVRSK
jgi:PAS domain S-box-containing protein